MVDEDVLEKPFRAPNSEKTAPPMPSEERVSATDLVVSDVVGKDATPELLRVYENYNLVEFDGTYYGAKHSIEINDWRKAEQRRHPDIVTASTEKGLLDKIRKQLEHPQLP